MSAHLGGDEARDRARRALHCALPIMPGGKEADTSWLDPVLVDRVAAAIVQADRDAHKRYERLLGAARQWAIHGPRLLATERTVYFGSTPVAYVLESEAALADAVREFNVEDEPAVPAPPEVRE